ncbi:tyrosine-type recombinase/integrase [Methylomagnum sp.]
MDTGFYLLINHAGKYWRLKYRWGGRKKGLSLGVYPDVSLTEAREKRDTYRQLLKNGHDPAESQKANKQVEQDAFPSLGARPVNEVETPEILDMVRAIERRGALETAGRVMQRCAAVFRYLVCATLR